MWDVRRFILLTNVLFIRKVKCCTAMASIRRMGCVVLLGRSSAPWFGDCPKVKRYSPPALGSMMIRLVCLRVRTVSGLSFFSWRRSKECNGQTERFDAISKDLKKRGMKFVGSIIIYAYLQAVGVINSHESICFLKSSQR